MYKSHLGMKEVCLMFILNQFEGSNCRVSYHSTCSGSQQVLWCERMTTAVNCTHFNCSICFYSPSLNLTVLSFVSCQNLSPNFILRNCSPMMLANNSPTSPSFTANSEIPEKIGFVITLCFLATNKIFKTQKNWWVKYSTYVPYSQSWHILIFWFQ